MGTKTFTRILIVLTILTSAIILVLNQVFQQLAVHTGFSFGSIALFVLICIAAFVLGKRAVKSTNKYQFIQVLIMIIMGKMFLSIGVILVYMKLMNPDNKAFVLPFLLIYLIYTAFEVFFLEKIAREDEKPTVHSSH